MMMMMNRLVTSEGLQRNLQLRGYIVTFQQTLSNNHLWP